MECYVSVCLADGCTSCVSFGRVQFVHVSIARFSHVVYVLLTHGSPTHCLSALAVMGHPQHLKMGSAPAYDFSALQNCCAQNTDIPYNPQRQANGERSHR